MNHSSSAPKQKVHSPHILVRNEGSIFLLTPVSDLATDWVDHHLAQDSQHFGDSIVIEHRYIADILEGIQENGLTVEEE